MNNYNLELHYRHIPTIDEPDKLLEFIDSQMTVKELEKKILGEVFTPMKLINQMLDTLDIFYEP